MEGFILPRSFETYLEQYRFAHREQYRFAHREQYHSAQHRASHLEQRCTSSILDNTVPDDVFLKSKRTCWTVLP
jgi:predicted TPR repeat methyltransferase